MNIEHVISGNNKKLPINCIIKWLTLKEHKTATVIILDSSWCNF